MPDRAAAQLDFAEDADRSRRIFATMLATGFWISAALAVVLSLVFTLLPRSLAFDLGSAPRVERVGENRYRAEFGRPIPDDCVLTLKGEALTRVNNPASVGTSNDQYSLDSSAGLVVWSSNIDALAQQRLFSYSLVTRPGAWPSLRRQAKLLWIPAFVVVVCGTAIVRRERRAGPDLQLSPVIGETSISGRLVESIVLAAPPTIRVRFALIIVCAVCVSAALVPRWDLLISVPDSNSYVTHSLIRTPLVPYWLDMFDWEKTASHTGDLFNESRLVVHWGGNHHLIWGVRAWKLLLLPSVCLLVWRLSAIVNWWLLGSMVCAAVSFDASLRPRTRGMSGYLDVVLAEGLSHALTILCIALVVGYLARPGWTRGLLVAACVNLLLLARPGNLPFVALFGLIWLFHLRRDAFGFATLRAGALAGVTFTGILLHCSINYANYGYFKQHAFTGFNLMTTALQLATPEDVELFDDPELKEFIRVCTVDLAHKRNPELTDAAATQNCWQLACPAYAQVFGETVFVDPYKADAVFTTVSRGLLRRHSAEFARQVFGSFTRGFWTTWLHVPLLLVMAASLWKFMRTGDWPWLFLAWFAALPFLTVGPCCLTNTPLDRYRSQTYFAELWSVPLWLAVVHCRWSQHPRGAKSECSITDDEMSGGCLAQHSTRAKPRRESVASIVTLSHR